MKRSLRKLLVRSFNPLDYVARVINGKRHLPPLHLRWDVGPLRGYEASAAEFRVYLKLFAGLKPDSRVLDIGCGCGQIARELLQELNESGAYVGCDISREAIEWCSRNMPRFTFFWVNVANGMYNPAGNIPAREFRVPTDFGQFDVILLKSVFTHMQKGDIESYLNQVSTLLQPGGKCLATFFLLNEQQRNNARAGRNLIQFSSPKNGIAYADIVNPEAIVALEEAEMMEMVERCNLHVSFIKHGSWTGCKEGLSHQDLVLLELRS